MFGIGFRVWNRNLGYGTVTWEIDGLRDWYEVKFDSGVTRNMKYTRLKHAWEV